VSSNTIEHYAEQSLISNPISARSPGAIGAVKRADEIPKPPNLNPPQPTEEQILRDEYSLQCDKVEIDKTRIEDQYRNGQINSDTRDRELAKIERKRVEWLKSRRTLVERYWGAEWYQKNVPQELGAATESPLPIDYSNQQYQSVRPTISYMNLEQSY
jgi:hypothetical protein